MFSVAHATFLAFAAFLQLTALANGQSPCGWSPWKDRDNPSGTGDWELLSGFQGQPGICRRPNNIQCQTTSGLPYQYSGDSQVICNPQTGLVCQNKYQPGGRLCKDYRVRFHCPCHQRYCWSSWMDRDNPSGTGDWELLSSAAGRPGFCRNPISIQCQTTNGQPYQSTGDSLICNTQTGLVCQNSKQPNRRYCRDYRIRVLCPCGPSPRRSGGGGGGGGAPTLDRNGAAV